MHNGLPLKADSRPHKATSLINPSAPPDNIIVVLLLNLIGLLARRRLSLVPVLYREVERIMCDLQLRANTRLDRLDKALWALRLLVLVLVSAVQVGEGRESKFLELGGVFLDDGDALLKLRERRVAQLVGTGQVRRDVRVGCLQVGVEGRDEGVVCVVEEGEGLGAVGVGLVELDRVVHDRVGV